MSFWSNYVILKEQDGIERSITLAKIEAKYGTSIRQQIEVELAQIEPNNQA